LNRTTQTSGSPLQSSTAPAPPRRLRIDWIDFFRGAAVLVMIETHVVNTFLATTIRAEPWFIVLNYLNGLVAPSFLFIAGFVQGMERARQPRKPVNYVRRAWRLLGLFALGYALHFPWFELVQHRWDDALRIGSQVDVLQCIAASLGLLLFLGWLAEGRQSSPAASPREALWWCAVSALLLLIVLIAPAVANPQNLPIPLEAWMNSGTGSWFPLFPWAGFVLVGALAGAASRLGQENAEPATTPGPFALIRRPTTLAMAPLPLAFCAWAARDVHYSSVSLASFLERCAWVLVLAAACQWLAARRRLPRLVLFAGQHSLTLYVAHLVLISAMVGFGVTSQTFPLPIVLMLLAVVAGVSLLATRGFAELRRARN
jgi:uncharacterized membrane protein